MAIKYKTVQEAILDLSIRIAHLEKEVHELKDAKKN